MLTPEMSTQLRQWFELRDERIELTEEFDDPNGRRAELIDEDIYTVNEDLVSVADEIVALLAPDRTAYLDLTERNDHE